MLGWLKVFPLELFHWIKDGLAKVLLKTLPFYGKLIIFSCCYKTKLYV